MPGPLFPEAWPERSRLGRCHLLKTVESLFQKRCVVLYGFHYAKHANGVNGDLAGRLCYHGFCAEVSRLVRGKKEPQMDADERRLNQITEKIIGCAYEVANTLGAGFLEKVYENALRVELQREGLDVRQQHPVSVTYRGEPVGEYFADLLVESSVVVELKAVKMLDEIHMAQCLNYLKATGLKICLLLNFGKPKLEIKRIVNNM